MVDEKFIHLMRKDNYPAAETEFCQNGSFVPDSCFEVAQASALLILFQCGFQLPFFF